MEQKMPAPDEQQRQRWREEAEGVVGDALAALLAPGGPPPTHALQSMARAVLVLLDETEQVRDVHRRIMAEECPTDEVHCACVPVLRAEIGRLAKAHAEERAAVQELVALARGAAEALATAYPYEAGKLEEACERVEALMEVGT